MTPTTKNTIVHSLLEEAGQVAERYYSALSTVDQRQQEFCASVGPALKAAANLTGVTQRQLTAATGAGRRIWGDVFMGRGVLTRSEYITAVRLLTGQTQVP
jgi:hypothetical protein